MTLQPMASISSLELWSAGVDQLWSTTTPQIFIVFLLSTKPSSGPGPDRQQLSVHIPSLSSGLEEDLLTRTPNCECTLDFSGAPSFLILISSAHQVHTRKLTRLLVPLFQEFRLEEELRQVHQSLNIRRVIRGTSKVINRVGKIPYILPAPKPES